MYLLFVIKRFSFVILLSVIQKAVEEDCGGDFSSDEEGSYKPSDESSVSLVYSPSLMKFSVKFDHKVIHYMFQESSSESSMDEDESPYKVNDKVESKTKMVVSTPQSRATSSRTSRRTVKEEKDFVRNYPQLSVFYSAFLFIFMT